MDDVLKDLELRAATIDELLSERFLPLPGQKADSVQASSRLAAWCCASAGGDWLLFAKRLARDGLTFEAVLSRFATAVRNPEVPPARWVDDCACVYAALTADAPHTLTCVTRKAFDPIPFTPLLAGLVQDAENRLLAGADGYSSRLVDDDAMGDMRSGLLRQLSELCSPALFQQLKKWRAHRPASKEEPIAQAGGSSRPDPQFLQFVTFMRDAGFRELLTAKPVLLRLMNSITMQWINTNREFLCRFQSDRAKLRQFAVGREDDCALVSITGGLSDLHNHGRSVLLLTFEDGSRVLYKPKDLSPDAQMTTLIAWLNDREPPVDLRLPRMMLRDHYGWAEFIEHTDTKGRGRHFTFLRASGSVVGFVPCAVRDGHAPGKHDCGGRLSDAGRF